MPFQIKINQQEIIDIVSNDVFSPSNDELNTEIANINDINELLFNVSSDSYLDEAKHVKMDNEEKICFVEVPGYNWKTLSEYLSFKKYLSRQETSKILYLEECLDIEYFRYIEKSDSKVVIPTIKGEQSS